MEPSSPPSVTATTASIPPTAAAVGLGPIHLAVLQNNPFNVHRLLSNGEHGVDQRIPKDNVTPIMLACLFGFKDVFIVLLHHGASLQKRDRQGRCPQDYIGYCQQQQQQPQLQSRARRGTSSRELEALVAKYIPFASQKPKRLGWTYISMIIKWYRKGVRRSQCQRTAANANTNNDDESNGGGVGSNSNSNDTNDDNRGNKDNDDQQVQTQEEETIQHPSVQSTKDDTHTETRTIFLRKGKILEICEVRVIASVELDHKLGRKSLGAIRGKDDTLFSTFALSGWSGDAYKEKTNIETVLDNRSYYGRSRHACVVFNQKLRANWLDHVKSSSYLLSTSSEYYVQ